MLRMMSPTEPFSRVVHFTAKLKPHYIVDEEHRLTNPKTRSNGVPPEISINEDNPISVLNPTLTEEGFILKLKSDTKLIEHSIKTMKISGEAKETKSKLDFTK